MEPLLRGSDRRRKPWEYKPWSHTDLDRVVGLLPPLQKGAEAWITALETSIPQDVLALADMRALLIRLDAATALHTAEIVAGCSHSPDIDHFIKYRSDFWKSQKETYPQKCDFQALSSLKLGKDEELYIYLKRAEKLSGSKLLALGLT